MKNYKLLKTLLVLIGILIGSASTQMWAATSTTLYFCPGICGKNWTTPYVNVCTMWNSDSDNHWSNLAMSEVSGKTVDGYKVYSVTFTDEYNGARTIEFHASQNNYTGSLKPVNASWTSVATYNGKLCNAAGNGWMTYETDHTIASGATVVWDLAGDNWGSNAYLYRAHYVADADHDAMTKLANNQFYKTYNANTKCKLFLFRNANGSTWADYKQTTDITGSNCDLSNNITLFTYPNTVSGKKLNWQKTTNAKKATSGVKVYFDNTASNWGEVWLKYGTQWYNRSSAATATQVTGTDALYVITIPNDCYYAKWYLADHYGYTGYNNIETMTDINNRIAYQETNISSDITYIPSTGSGTPKVWTTTTMSGHTRELTISAPSNGSINVTYTDEGGVERTKTSGSFDVAQTCKVVITATPSSGYALSALTLGGEDITSGAEQIIRADGTIAATFVAETTHDVTVSYKIGTRTLHVDRVVAVGETTPSNISSETVDGFSFSSWSNLTSGITNVTGNTTTDPIRIKTTADASMTCNYTQWPCSLDIVPSEGATTYTSRTPMSYDATTKAYYKNVSTASSTERYRFYIDSKEYSTSGNTELVIAGTKVDANTPVQGYGSNKPSVYFNDGGTGSNITVWFDYENKKAWVTEQKHTVTISAGNHGSVSPASVTVGNVVKSGSITATPSSHYHLSSWTIPSGVTLVDGSTTTSPITIKATADDKEVTASFAGDVYSITYKDQGGGDFSGSQTTPPTSHTYGTATTLKIPTKSGYTFGGWFTSIDCTTGAIGNTSAASLGATAFTANITLYAKWTENMTTVNLVASPTGKGTFTKGGDAVTSVSAGVTTHPTVTAVPGTGYYVNTSSTVWSESSDYISISSTTATATTITGSGTSGNSATLTATFTPNPYKVKFNGNGNTGGSMDDQNFTYDVAQNLTANAFTKTGYNFGGWATSPSGTKAYNDGQSVSNLTTTKNGTFNLYAKWTPKSCDVDFDFDESDDGYGSKTGATTSTTATYDAAMTSVTPPTAAQGYAFMGYFTAADGEGTQYYDASGNSAATWAVNTEDDVTLYAYYKKAEVTGITFSPAAIVATNATVTATPTISPTPTGTTAVCWELQYSNGTRVPSQPTFTPGVGNAVSFTAPSTSATYRLQAVLHLDDCNGDELSVYSETFQVAGEHTVTVRYQDSDGRTIKASTEITGRPLTWTTAGTITPPTITGYTFARWDAGDGVTIKNGDSDPVTTTTTSSIQIKAVYDGTLTAVYTKKRMIYFYNTLGWGSVYVYFYKNDSYWQTVSPYKGSGANTSYTWSSTPYSEGKHGQMLPVSEGSKIYYFDAEAAGVNASYDDVVFTEHQQHGYDYFYQTNAVRRGDYKTTMPMFVPLAAQTADVHNETNYYNSGYWMNYPENTGYTLKIYNAWDATKETAAVQSIAFPYSEDQKMPLKMDVELSDGYKHDYWFMVYRNDGTYLGSDYHFKQGYQSEQTITGGDNKNQITTSAPGNYTFTLTYHDNGSGTNNYYIDVDFPIATGDYRIVYKDNAAWSNDTHGASWCHPSHSIAKATTEAKKDTVSFFISKAVGITPSMKFQKASVDNEGVVTWADVAGGSITIPSSVTTTGVYNFIVSQPAGGASISLEKVEPYTGNFYIRTDCAGNTKWDSFKNVDHQMTYSDYAEDNSGYSHYFVHWVENGNNVKFTIANDYSMCISDTLTQDYGTVVANIDANGFLASGSAHNANIRFMWNQATNKISRAYISGSSNVADRFLVLEGDARMYDESGNALSITGLNANEINLVDDQNFVYERTIQVKTTARAKLTAKYNNNVQYFKGSSGAFAEGTTIQLLGGEASNTKHTMRIVYDFKTNRLVTAYVPSGTIESDLAINADLMIVREHQNAGQQLLFNGGSLSDVHTVYGVMRFNKWTLNNKETTGGHSIVGDPKSAYERSVFWISFPFDVKLSDVFGFGTYGVDWIIEYYDGTARAAEGYWADSKGFWKYVMPSQRSTYELKAGKGYALVLDLARMKDDNEDFWPNSIEQVELFFPSTGNVGGIEATNVTTTAESHLYDAAAHPGHTDDRTYKDSHWNMIGVPSYANYGTTLTSDGSTTITWSTPVESDLPYLYEWNAVDNTYTAQTGSTYPFKSMHSYMVQYHGSLYWSLASATPVTPIVARRTYAEKPQNVELRLELSQDEKMIDQTFVKLSNDEEVSAAFKFDEDLSKEMNKNKANIYTMIADLSVAGNTMPMSEQTTVVPVGVKIAADGDYTFAIPDGTEGIGVTLVDTETGVRTSLSALDYTVNLSAGTYNERFVLEISPIKQTPTGIENSEVSHQHSDTRKVLIDGILYIVKDGKMFDARGAVVK